MRGPSWRGLHRVHVPTVEEADANLRAGVVTTRAELLSRVWNRHFDPGSNVVDVHVTRLRRKLDQAWSGVPIEARRGHGFMLIPADR